MLLVSASEFLFDDFQPLAGDFAVGGGEGEVGPEVLGGFGEAVGFGEEGGNGKVGSGVGVAGFLEEADGFFPIFELSGEGDSQ